MLAGQAGHPIQSGVRAAKENAVHALQLDATSPEAQLAFARVCQRVEWDWVNADLHFRAAINLNPGFATAHQWYGGFLSNLGKQPQALQETRIARDLDPLSIPVNLTYGAVLTRMGKWDEAIQQFQFALTLAPNSGAAYSLAGDAYAGKRDWANAIEMKRHAIEIFNDADSWSGLAYGLARSGRTADALKILSDLQNEHASHVPLSQIYTGLGQYNEAIHELELAFDAHEPSLVSVKVEPQNAALRPLPRFQALLKKLKVNE
jgi:tetratricopeptide (TPR) repeat protein